MPDAPTPTRELSEAEETRVEHVTALLIEMLDDGSPEWAEAFVKRAKNEPHYGDCPYVERPAPITCERCCWDQYSAKARRIIDAVRHPDQSPVEVQQDPRLPGLQLAEGIADHEYQRFLVLRQEAIGEVVQQRILDGQATGAKRLLDEIEAERARIVNAVRDEGLRHG